MNDSDQILDNLHESHKYLVKCVALASGYSKKKARKLVDAAIEIHVNKAILQHFTRKDTKKHAPLKFTAGTLPDTPEAGAIEYNGSDWM